MNLSRNALRVIFLAGLTRYSSVESSLGRSSEETDCFTVPYLLREKIEREIFNLLELSLAQEKLEPYIFLSSIAHAYTKTLEAFPKPLYSSRHKIAHIDALMIDNPTDDFLKFSSNGEKICKVIVKEMQKSKTYSEKLVLGEEHKEKNIYIDRRDIFHPVHYKVYQEHFLKTVPSLKALLIVFPLYKQTHPIADMIIRSFSRKDIESLRISGESILQNEHITTYYNILLCIKEFLSTHSFENVSPSVQKEVTKRALYSLFTLHITGDPESYKNVQFLSIDTTSFRKIVIDLSVFSSCLKTIVIEQNYFLHTVIIVVPESMSFSSLPEIETDITNEDCCFKYILSDDFRQINH